MTEQHEFNHVRKPEEATEDKGRSRRAISIVFVAALLILIASVSAPIWLGWALRTLIPDRYIAAYAPEPVAEWIFKTDADQTLPTAVPQSADDAIAILEAINTPTPDVEPTPTVGEQSSNATAAPTDTPTITPTSTPALAPTILLEGFQHTYQGWNNCGPATLTTTLSYWFAGTTQQQVADFVKPNPEDRNVRPDELAAYAESVGYSALVRVDGDMDTLRRLISAGYPPIIEKGFDPEPDRLGWMGHYVMLAGYSDTDEKFVAMDSYLGPSHEYLYEVVEEFWPHFNYTYLVVYPSEDAEAVATIIGDEMNDGTMYQNAIATAQETLSADPANAFAWFNIGSSLVALGDHESAAAAYDQARNLGLPWRMLWYQFGMYDAYMTMDRYEDVVTLADATLSNNEYSEEAYYYKGIALAALGEENNARYFLNLAIQNNTNYTRAREALAALN